MVQDAEETGCEVTALVVKYADGRAARMHDETADGDDADVCIVYDDDTLSAAAAWLFAERGFERCRRAEALAEVVMVTVLEPADPADLEATLQVAARAATVSYGFVRAAELYSDVG